MQYFAAYESLDVVAAVGYFFPAKNILSKYKYIDLAKKAECLSLPVSCTKDYLPS